MQSLDCDFQYHPVPVGSPLLRRCRAFLLLFPPALRSFIVKVRTRKLIPLFRPGVLPQWLSRLRRLRLHLYRIILNSFYLNSNELISKSHSLQHPNSREFKKLRRQLRGKRHIKIADYSMLITLYKIIGVHFRLLGTNGFHVKAKNERFTAGSSRCLQNLKYENFMSSFGRL